jgi:Ser/Thr protein kinase RdoA (MazF antagonist)
VLNREVVALVAERYGINEVACVTPLRGGTADCYRIETKAGDYVLKVFQGGYSVEDVAFEPELTAFLRERGLPVTRFLPTSEGEYVWTRGGRACHLQEFAQGTMYGQNTAPTWLLRESAALLAQIQVTLVDYPLLGEGFHSSWYFWDVVEKRREYNTALEQAEALPAGETRERIINDLQYKKDLLQTIAGIAIDPNKLTLRNSHGDFHIQQIICGEESVRAVIDFSAACALPVAWEIIRSYTLGDPKCRKGQVFGRNLKKYVRVYLDNGGALSPYDLETMVNLYYVQLTRSLFGYAQYLAARDKAPLESLLEFAFWRTDMCRWFEAHGEEQTEDLRGILE